MITHIIWDFDGTLFDTYPMMVKAFRRALKDLGKEAEASLIFQKMKISVGHAVQYFSEQFLLKQEKVRELYRSYSLESKPEDSPPFLYAEDFCRDFTQQGGTNFIFTHRGDSTLKYLEHYDMLRYFKEVITSRYGFVKPEPEGFLYFSDKYGIHKNCILVVGDRDIEIIGAKRANMKSCLYNTGEIEWNLSPDYTINSLKDLYKILDIV